jgi:hypothetical protein
VKLLAGAVVAAAAAGFGGAWWLQSLRWEAADGRRAKTDAESQRLAQRAADRAAGRFEVERARIAGQRLIITREVERVIVADAAAAAAVCLSDDGLRLIASAVAGDDPGQPAPAVPAASAAAR